MRNLKIIGIVSFFLQLILSIMAVVFIVSLDVLPVFYVFWIVFILTLLLLISAIFIIARSKVRVYIGMIFALIMSIVLALVSFGYLNPAINLLENITTHHTSYSVKYHIII